jgi:hypothetical protein
VKTKSLEKVLCVVVLALIPAQQISQAEEPAGGRPPVQAVFGYRVSIGARVQNALIGRSGFPFDVPVELTPIDPSAFANATENSTVILRVVRDVIVGKYTDAYGGTFIEAKVTRVREGKLRTRRGKTEPRVMEITVTATRDSCMEAAPGSLDSSRLKLESYPESSFGRTAKQLAVAPLTAIRFVVVYPVEAILFAILCSTGCDL